MFGGTLGAFLSGSIAERFGRKKSILAANFIMLTAIAMMDVSFQIMVLILARFILGFGMGVTMMVGQVFISESSPNELRGRTVASYILLIFLGFIVSHICSLIFAYQLNLMFGIGAIPLLI